MNEERKNKCGCKCEIYSRVCGYMRPVGHWNKGKQAEFNDRVEYRVPLADDLKVRELKEKLNAGEQINLDDYDIDTVRNACNM